jgi:hypothetical protein
VYLVFIPSTRGRKRKEGGKRKKKRFRKLTSLDPFPAKPFKTVKKEKKNH